MSASYRVRGQPTSQHRSSQYRPRNGWRPTAGGQPPGTAPTEQTRLSPAPATTGPQPQLFAGDLPAAQQTRPLLARKSLSPDEREQLVADHRQLIADALRPHQLPAVGQRAWFGLAQAAQIGLLLAAESFDPSRQRFDQFADYARPLIQDEIALELAA